MCPLQNPYILLDAILIYRPYAVILRTAAVGVAEFVSRIQIKTQTTFSVIIHLHLDFYIDFYTKNMKKHGIHKFELRRYKML